MKVVIEFIDHESKHRARTVDLDMDQPAVRRDAIIASIIGTLSPDFIKVTKYYREPQLNPRNNLPHKNGR